jgi:aminomethyltransferase
MPMTSEALRLTPFHRLHQELGARMVPFAGFSMPIQYTGIIEEHLRVRERVGLFDVSHMGEFEFVGPGALAFLQRMTINDVSRLSPGRVQYSALCTPEGGIIDDLLVYRLGPERFMLVVNASNIEKDRRWLAQHLAGEVEFHDRSDETALLAVQGPSALAALQPLTATDLAGLRSYHCVETTVADISVLVSRTGYTGELGFELYFPARESEAAALWQALMRTGAPYGIGPVGLGARDTLRLEMGYCLYGNDIDETTTPLEAGLGWITKLEKGEFIGREALQTVRERGIARSLVGFSIAGSAVPRNGHVLQRDGVPRGKVTSGSFSPVLRQAIGLGYVEVSHAQPGSVLQAVIRGREVPATVVPLPFVKR